MTHLVLMVPREVTTPSITFDPKVPFLVRTSSTAQFSTTFAPDLVENLDKLNLNKTRVLLSVLVTLRGLYRGHEGQWCRLWGSRECRIRLRHSSEGRASWCPPARARSCPPPSPCRWCGASCTPPAAPCCSRWRVPRCWSIPALFPSQPQGLWGPEVMS